MVQLCPIAVADGAAYGRHHGTFMAALNRVAGDLSWYSERFSPYPLLLNQATLDTFARLRAAIDRAMVRVVENYFGDVRLQRIIALSDAHRALLARAGRAGGAYRVGSFRPDLLLDASGVWRVCEVNARFPVNGYLSSYYVNRFIGQLDYLADCRARPVATLDGLLEAIVGRFTPGLPLVIVRDREKGMDTHLLAPELERRGIPVRVRAPSALAVRHGSIYDAGAAVGQFILELERDELLSMPQDLFDALAACPAYFNDLRTLLLAHDKRMLAVLSDAAIMADYVDAADRALLARHVLPTYNAGDVRIAADLAARPGDWVLKRNSSGRGIGMLLGRACDAALWRRTLAVQAEDYTAQRYLQQRPLLLPTLRQGGVVRQAMKVVGMLPGFDGQLFGPGFFRVGCDDVINAHSGSGEIVAAMELV